MAEQGPHDCEHYRQLFGHCTACAAERIAQPEPAQITLGLGEVACSLGCGEAVDPRDGRTFRRMAGWARDRNAGGTHALALRMELHQYAHAECIEAAKAGRLGQPPLPIETEGKNDGS